MREKSSFSRHNPEVTHVRLRYPLASTGVVVQRWRRAVVIRERDLDHITAIPDPWGFAVRLGLGTGLRWGEMQRAKAGDVLGNVLTVSQTKSGRVRRIPLGEGLLREIRSHVGLLLPFRDPSVFARKVRRLSGVQRFHPHQLRHTFACT